MPLQVFVVAGAGGCVEEPALGWRCRRLLSQGLVFMLREHRPLLGKKKEKKKTRSNLVKFKHGPTAIPPGARVPCAALVDLCPCT